MAEIKYIIVKNKNGQLRHLKSDWLHHFTIARDNGYLECDIIECVIFLDKKNFILECSDKKHLERRLNRYIGIRLNEYQENKLELWLKGRELESQLFYKKQKIGIRDGD